MVLEKVLVITYYWPPSGGAGVQRTLKFVKYFPEFGLKPVVLTVDPLKASYPVVDDSLMKDVPPDVKVITTDSFEPLNILSSIAGKKNVPYGGFANANKESFTQKSLRWIRGNFFIPDARVGWVQHAFRAAEKIIQEENIRCVYISSPPHSSQLIGLKLKKRFPQLRWVADLRDPWTDIYYYKDLLHTKLALKKDARLEERVYRAADALVVVGENLKASLLRKVPDLNPSVVNVITNGYDESDFSNSVSPDAEYFTITYVGTMADSYRPEVLFSVLKRLMSAYASVNIRFRFVGVAPTTIVQMAIASGISEKCEWIGHVKHPDAINYLMKSNVLVLIIPESEGAKGILTGKLFEYLGAGHPVLGIGPGDGDAATILHACEAGRMFERDQSEEMYSWLNRELNAWMSGKLAAEVRPGVLEYRRVVLAKKLADIIKQPL